MFERFLCSLLNDSFGDFIIGIDKDQLQFSLWNGHIAVENVEFRPTALNILLRSLFPLPLMIVHACARSLSVHLHWRQLKHEPIWIKLKGLNLVVKLGRNYGKELNTEHTTSTTPNSSPSVKESGQGVGEQGEQQDQGGGQGEEQIEEEKQELIHVEAKAIEHEAIQRKIEILKDEEEALINAVMFAMDEDNRMGDAMGEGGSRVQGAGRGGDYQFRSRKTTMTEKLLLAMLQALHIQVEDIRIQFELDIPINKSSPIPPSSSERMEEGERNTKQAATSSQLIPIHPATISVLLNIGSLSMVNTASIENGMERNVLIHKECKIRDITISVHANKLSHTRSPRSLSPDLDSICSSFIVQPFSTTLTIAFNGDLNAMRGEFLLDISEIIALLSPASAFVVSLFAHEFMDAYDAMENKIVHIVHNQRHGTDAERKEYIYLYKSTLNAMWTQKLTEDNYKRMHQLEKEISLADLRLYRRSAIAELKVELPVGQYVVRRSSIEEPVRHWYDSCLWGGVDDSAKDPDIMLTEDDRERIFNLLACEEAANPAFKQHPPATADTTASLSADSNSPVALSSLPSEIGEGTQQVLFNPQPSDPSIYASRLFVATALAETVSSSTMTAASLSQPMQRAILRIGLTIPSVWVALCEEASPFTDLLPNAVQDMEKILTNNVTILSAANFYTPLFDAISIGLARPHFARIALDFSGVQANINFDYGLIDTNIQVKGVHLMQTAPSEPANREPIKSDFILAIGNLEALRREKKSQTSNALEIRMLYKNNTDGGSPSSLPDAFNGDMIINPIHLSLNSTIFFSMQIAKRFIAANEVARLCTLFRTVVLAQPTRAKANLSEEEALPPDNDTNQIYSQSASKRDRFYQDIQQSPLNQQHQ